jgi:Leucine-rich repeat (LRR) protein
MESFYSKFFVHLLTLFVFLSVRSFAQQSQIGVARDRIMQQQDSLFRVSIQDKLMEGVRNRKKLKIDSIINSVRFIEPNQVGATNLRMQAATSQSAALPTQTEYAALIDFYNSTGGINWVNNTGWRDANPNVVSDVSDWFGVGVDQSGHVVSLSLPGNNLIGSIPVSIGNLFNLKILDLPWRYDYNLNRTFLNQLIGSLPTSIWSCMKMEVIDLDLNKLTGSIPEDIGDLSNLQFLILQRNNFSGSIPNRIGDCVSLKELLLGFNQISGVIPDRIGDCISLETLSLAQNQISGVIPDRIGDCYNLKNLSLVGNQISGAIPDRIGDCFNLTSIGLGANLLTGTIPERIFIDCNKLMSFDVSYNKLSGSIPALIGNLKLLRSFSASNNNFSGIIPSQIGECKVLDYFGLDNNHFSGSIPSSVGDCTNLRVVLLSNNTLTGQIPDRIGDCSKLESFFFQSNSISGSIPSTLGRCTKLVHLSGANNSLSGQISPATFNSQSLLLVSLRNNQLSGSIPYQIANCSALEWLDLTNNQFTGSIPAQFGGMPNLKFLLLSGNLLQGAIPIGRIFLNGVCSISNPCSYHIQNNYFTFQDIVPAMNQLSGNSWMLERSPQKLVDSPKEFQQCGGSPLILSTQIDRSTSPASLYQWFLRSKNGLVRALTQTPTPSESGHTVTIPTEAGEYFYQITNPAVTDLTLTSVSQMVKLVGDDISLSFDESADLCSVRFVPHTSDGNSNCNVISYKWDFGDGTSSQEEKPTHSYSTFGIYTVSLKLTYQCLGCAAEANSTKQISVNPILAGIRFDTSPYLCATLFTPTVDYSTLSCNAISYQWNFGDGTTSLEQRPMHVYSSPGSYAASLKLIYQCGGCTGEANAKKQITFSPTTTTIENLLVEAETDVKKQVITASAATFSDVWPLPHDNAALLSKNSFFNGSQGVWRNNGSYAYEVPRLQSPTTNVATDGTFTMDQFDWGTAEFNIVPNWIQANSMTQYSPYSYELENRDVLGVYSAALYDYGGHLPSANGVNMRNGEMAFTSFEVDDGKPTGNWMISNLATPASLTYNVPVGLGHLAVIEATLAELEFVQLVDVSAQQSFFFGSLVSAQSKPTTFLQGVKILCKQVHPTNPNLTIVVLDKAPFEQIWRGKITVNLTALPAVAAVLDNVLAHSGKKSLKITADKTFRQELLRLEPGKPYWLNAWVSVNNPHVLTPVLASNLGIDVTLKNKQGVSVGTFAFQPTGQVIEGWQQVKGSFVSSIKNPLVEIKFKPGSTGTAWYDDLRLQPERGNMKAYVYDLNDYRLRAILDEENFASFFFYDAEGNLYLTKKETERGTKTITENMSYQVEK